MQAIKRNQAGIQGVAGVSNLRQISLKLFSQITLKTTGQASDRARSLPAIAPARATGRGICDPLGLVPGTPQPSGETAPPRCCACAPDARRSPRPGPASTAGAATKRRTLVRFNDVQSTQPLFRLREERSDSCRLTRKRWESPICVVRDALSGSY